MSILSHTRIYVNGHIRENAKLQTLNLIGTLSNPNTATIYEPYGTLSKNELKKGLSCVIKVDNNYVFAGIITSRSTRENAKGSWVYYNAVGNEFWLSNYTCYRSYNLSEKDLYYTDEVVTTRFIVADLIKYFNTQSSKTFTVNFSAFMKDVFAGEQQVEGFPIANVLDDLLAARVTGGPARWKVRYLNDTNIQIIPYYPKFGRARRLVFATDNNKYWDAQPGGLPKITEVDENSEHRLFYNRIVVRGDFRRFQTSMTLQKGWDATSTKTYTPPGGSEITVTEEQYIMNHYMQSTTKEWQGIPNEDYIPFSNRVGTTWHIPDITLTDPKNPSSTATFRPKIERRLIQDTAWLDLFGETDLEMKMYSPTPAFLMYKFSGDVSYQIKTDGFSITTNKDGAEWVVLNKPLYKFAYSAELERFVFEFPSEILLTCTVIDTVRLSYDTGKLGNEPYTATRYYTHNELKWEGLYHSYAVYKTAGAWTSEYVTDFTATRTDAASAQALAVCYTKELKESIKTYMLEIDNPTTTYEVGDVIKSNISTINNGNITAINYDIWNNDELIYKQMLTVAVGWEVSNA